MAAGAALESVSPQLENRRLAVGDVAEFLLDRSVLMDPFRLLGAGGTCWPVHHGLDEDQLFIRPRKDGYRPEVGKAEHVGQRRDVNIHRSTMASSG